VQPCFCAVDPSSNNDIHPCRCGGSWPRGSPHANSRVQARVRHSTSSGLLEAHVLLLVHCGTAYLCSIQLECALHVSASSTTYSTWSIRRELGACFLCASIGTYTMPYHFDMRELKPAVAGCDIRSSMLSQDRTEYVHFYVIPTPLCSICRYTCTILTWKASVSTFRPKSVLA
jgi:hypothetical protein